MTEWNSLFQHYESPPYVLPHTSGAYSFGIAGQRRTFLSIFMHLLIYLLIIGSRGSHESLWPFCLQALELGSPFTGMGLDLLRSSMEKRWTGSLICITQIQLTQSLASLKDLLLFTQRWFFYPPNQEPHFDRNRTTLSWVTEVYPNLPEDEAPLECTIRPGEVTTLISLQKS